MIKGTERKWRERTYLHELRTYFTCVHCYCWIYLNFIFFHQYKCSWITSCHVETNHWTLRCFWQRLMKQDSWLAGFGRPAHRLSGCVCIWAPGLVLVQCTVLFLKPLPHLREHCHINGNMIMMISYVLKCFKYCFVSMTDRSWLRSHNNMTS